MKKIYSVSLILTTLLLLSSCEKFLDRKPLASVTTIGYYNTKENTTAAVNAIYDVWTWERMGHILNFQGDCASDDAETGGKASDPNDQVYAQHIMLYTTQSDNLFTLDFAKLCYTGIQRANNVLKGTDPSNKDLTFDPSEQRGEASCLRAIFYFYLANTMGPVPLITEPVSDDQFTTGNRASNDDAKGTKQLEKIYTQIISDLEYASSVLTSRASNSTGRVTKATAYGYLIKAYAVMASSKYIFTDKDKKEYWNKIIEYSDKIRAEDPRVLEPDYHRLFTVDGENSSESLFEIQFTTSGHYGPQGEGNIAPIDFGPRQLFDMPADLWGYGLNSPTLDLVKQFDINNGSGTPSNWKNEWVLAPKASDVIYPADSNTGAKAKVFLNNFLKAYMKKNSPNLYKDFVDYDPRLDLIAKPGDSIYVTDLAAYHKVRAFQGDWDGDFSVTGFWNKKTCSALKSSGGDQSNELNKILLRYADVLLIEAEARFATGDGNTATSLINQIRTRAQNSRYVPDQTVKGTYHVGLKIEKGTTPQLLASSDISLDVIQKERRKELFLEGIRFYDLVRWGLANSICSSRPAEFHGRTRLWRTDQTIYEPIPSTMISDGGGNVIQNPGY